MMTLYRIQHLPTGLYFMPGREIKVSGHYIKSNLSKTGKTYRIRPTLTMIGKYYYNHLQYVPDTSSAWPPPAILTTRQPVVAEEWAIVTMQNDTKKTRWTGLQPTQMNRWYWYQDQWFNPRPVYVERLRGETSPRAWGRDLADYLSNMRGQWSTRPIDEPEGDPQ